VNRFALAALTALCVFAARPSDAATFRVDDTASIPQESTARLKWRELVPGRRPDSTLAGAIAVAVRLNLAPWINRSGKLFLVLPEQPIGTVRASWTTQGRLLAGQLVSGQRALVYAGPITTPLLEETLSLSLEADGDRLGGAHRLNFHFEIDVE
jgi:hypothetical protein